MRDVTNEPVSREKNSGKKCWISGELCAEGKGERRAGADSRLEGGSSRAICDVIGAVVSQLANCKKLPRHLQLRHVGSGHKLLEGN